MKRPAEAPLEAEGRGGAGPPGGGGGNPFAGISFSSSAPSGSLFAAAAAGSGAAGGGFAPAAAAASGAAAAAPGGAANGKQANPFMGLSLFSPPAAGGLFTAAANSLQREGSEAPAASFPAAPGGTPAPSATESGAGAPEAAEPEEAPQDTPEGEPTGEEEEEVVFRAECRLWKLVRQGTTVAPTGGGATEAAAADGASGAGQQVEAAAGSEAPDAPTRTAAIAEERGWHWQERGCGIVHINRHGKTGAGRLVMRMRGVLKLLLNTPVFPTTKYERVGQKSVRFVGVDAEAGVAPKEGEVSLCAYRLNLQSGDQQGKFLAVLQDILGVAAAA